MRNIFFSLLALSFSANSTFARAKIWNFVKAGTVWTDTQSNTAGYCKAASTAVDFTKNSTFSISLWGKSTGASSAIIATNDNTANHGFLVYNDAANGFQPEFDIYDGTASLMGIFATSGSTTSAWHHMCFTYGGGNSRANMKIYYDGSIATVSTQGASSLSGTMEGSAHLVLGAQDKGATVAHTFVGKLDQVAIYNTELSSSDCNALYNAGHAADPSQLASWSGEVAYYPIGEGTDTNSVFHDGGGSNDANACVGASLAADAP